MVPTLHKVPPGWGYYNGTYVDVRCRLCNSDHRSLYLCIIVSNAMHVFYNCPSYVTYVKHSHSQVPPRYQQLYMILGARSCT